MLVNVWKKVHGICRWLDKSRQILKAKILNVLSRIWPPGVSAANR